MEQPTPQWITGTLYGSAQLEIFLGNGRVLVNCPVWVRLQLDQLAWQVAIPHHHFHIRLCLQPLRGKLTNIIFAANGSQPEIHIENIPLDEVRSSGSPQGNAAFFENWQVPDADEDSFPKQYKLLNLEPQESSFLEVQFAKSSFIYAGRYQFASKIEPQPLRLPSHITLHITCESQGDHYLVSLSSHQDWQLYEDVVLMALEIIAQAPVHNTQSIAGTKQTFYLTASHMYQGWRPAHIKTTMSTYLEAMVQRLWLLPHHEFERFKISTLHHLHAKASDVPTEIRYSMGMTWLEMVDGTQNLRAGLTASLFGISTEGAHFLQAVRNKLIHEVGTLDGAIDQALQQSFEELGINGPKARITRTRKIQQSLGLPDDRQISSFDLTLRLTERIDTAIWTFLGFAPEQIRRSKLVRWPSGIAPIPSQPPYYGGIKKAAEAALSR